MDGMLQLAGLLAPHARTKWRTLNKMQELFLLLFSCCPSLSAIFFFWRAAFTVKWSAYFTPARRNKLFMLSTFMKFIWLFCCRAVKSAVRGKLYRVSENKTRLRSTSHSTCGAIYMSSTSTIVIIQRYRFQKCAPNCIALRVAPSISQKI